MTELADSIVAASSCDMRHPAEATLDGREDTFFASTGCYPQEIIVKLREQAALTAIHTVTTNVRKLLIEKSGPGILSWEKLANLELEDTGGELQHSSQTLRPGAPDAAYVRIRINSGWGETSCVHRISVQGRPDD